MVARVQQGHLYKRVSNNQVVTVAIYRTINKHKSCQYNYSFNNQKSRKRSNKRGVRIVKFSDTSLVRRSWILDIVQQKHVVVLIVSFGMLLMMLFVVSVGNKGYSMMLIMAEQQTDVLR